MYPVSYHYFVVMFSDFGDSYRIYRACKLVQDLTDWSVSLQSGKQANPPRPLVSPGITCSPPSWVTWSSNILMRIIRVAFFHLVNLIACDGHHSTLKTLHLEIQMLPVCQIILKLFFSSQEFCLVDGCDYYSLETMHCHCHCNGDDCDNEEGNIENDPIIVGGF